ncbi:hypothetical protein ACRAWF_02525 [Streptomyces sp. L7]
MTSAKITAAAAGTWKLGDLTVNRIGFGAMRLTGSAASATARPVTVTALDRRAAQGN